MSTWNESVVRIHYTVCDRCSAGCDCQERTVAEAVKAAKERGWISKDGEILCPTCQQSEA